MKPSLGRIVLVTVSPGENNGADVAPAVITRVWSDEMVNVKVLTDAHESLWRTSVKLHAERPTDARNAAWWPPRV